ncbi:hypothetical protein TWF694_007722 [Orbilia ellipsospora]|uniref:Uncharacterized protein n=1 Tax=Orbilia ellipsospora TaxID=2528407 RepID=A0AAV9XJJ5_9PEZI
MQLTSIVTVALLALVGAAKPIPDRHTDAPNTSPTPLPAGLDITTRKYQNPTLMVIQHPKCGHRDDRMSVKWDKVLYGQNGVTGQSLDQIHILWSVSRS